MTAPGERDFFLFGAAAMGKVALDAALLEGWVCRGVFDDNASLHGTFLLPGFPVDGTRADMAAAAERLGVRSVLVAVGTNSIREAVTESLLKNGFTAISVRHPASNISALAAIADGVYVMGGVNIEAAAAVGAGTLLNTGSLIAHDCRVGAFCHVAVGAVLAGGVNLGDRTFIGANAVVKPGITIANDVTVGAGAAVVRDISEAGVWAGVPARRIEVKNQEDNTRLVVVGGGVILCEEAA